MKYPSLIFTIISLSVLACHPKMPRSSSTSQQNTDSLSPSSKSVVIYQQTKENFGPCEPSIAISPQNPNNLIAGSVLNFVHRSHDGGKTWETQTLQSPLGVFGDPCVIVDKKGRMYYFHLGDPDGTGWSSDRFLESIIVQTSDDAGKTWSKGAAIGPNPPKQQDKEWAVVDQNNNHVHISWTEFDKYGDDSETCRSRILYSRSEDRGKNWMKPIVLSGREGNCLDGDQTPEGAVPALDKKGNPFVAWGYDNKIYFDQSSDGGKTWNTEDRVVAQQKSGWEMEIPGLNRCNGMPVTGADLSNGKHSNNMYIVYADQKPDGSDTDIFLIRSTNGGKTWSSPTNVYPADNNRHQFLPWMSVDQRTGNIYIVFYDRSKRDDLCTDVMVAASKDGGMSFNHKIVSDTCFYPPGESTFFGDYNNIDAFAGQVRPIWTAFYDGKLSVHTALLYWP